MKDESEYEYDTSTNTEYRSLFFLLVLLQTRHLGNLKSHVSGHIHRLGPEGAI